MNVLENLSPNKVFFFFEEICKIPHGSGNMKKIADYCVEFATKRGLRFVRDDANNVIIYKSGTAGYEKREPVILQGHLDMVCQKTADSAVDFATDPINIYIDGDFVKAKNTTLGGDNGIAVAMVLAILDSDDLAHPPIEAVFTTDEEVGMLGAAALDVSCLRSKRMINIDSEEEDVLTVSCAGGLDFTATAAAKMQKTDGTALTFIIKGLSGGHSGVEIDKGRVNSNALAGRFLLALKNSADFELVSVAGGDKGNAIPLRTEVTVISREPDAVCETLSALAETIKAEIYAREPDFELEIIKSESRDTAFGRPLRDALIAALTLSPNGICEWSREIEGLVETSLNLGIFTANESGIFIKHALRSNKASAIFALADRLALLYEGLGFEGETDGYYPPWEYCKDSPLQHLYREAFSELCGGEVKVEAIHAGLECAVFADKIKGLDCISIGPSLFDVHTVNERMSISSTEKIFKILTKLLSKL